MENRDKEVLLIEDNPGDAELVKLFIDEIKSDTFNIRTTETLSEAVSILKENTFDVILSDLSLPDAQGIETINTLLSAASHTPCIVLSGNEDENLALQAVKLGAQDFIVKGLGNSHGLSRAIQYAIQRKHSEVKLAELAHHDPLTGLLNRALFNQHLNHAISRAKRHNDLIALFFIDLDKFKPINDTFGHKAGDFLLIEIANRMRNALREVDTISRLGGDEFTVITEGVNSIDDIEVVASKLIAAIRKPVSFEGNEINVTSSIGIAVYPQAGKTSEDLLAHADEAMYDAKSKGKNNYQFYMENFTLSDKASDDINHQIKSALKTNQFILYYQPIIDIKNGDILRAEALLRWHHPIQGITLPEPFLSQLTDPDVRITIDRWVINTAIGQLKIWKDSFCLPIKLSINLSPHFMTQNDATEFLLASLKQYNLDPENLEIELIHTDLCANTPKILPQLNACRKAGIRIAIDDFAAGRGSLVDLKSITVDSIKIDPYFVNDITFDARSTAMSAAVVALAHSLCENIIVEGIETEDQRLFFFNLDCHAMQGFLFSQALSATVFSDLLSTRLVSLESKKA